ncbi:hypothetical protein SAMN05192574_102443 [Mucilaginibacter gossypiicola]|uniref:Uncharacterized protein n=1 Tax=Mucilaginibacter gossypiicola TaxID=551995 RepID=A0A1H8DRA8_9SPHI|nr:hypothetical protein [Mucilaginibacter gossypiicola]SEN09802.1 hypothetical protein SAMN05192574_102443 [Mucilaginibacter gossypiicola]
MRTFKVLNILLMAENRKSETFREFMDSDGKINIVILVTIILLLGFGIFVWSINKKLKKAISKKGA